MKIQKFLFIFLILNIFISNIVLGKNYAILINGISNMPNIDEGKNGGRQWYDLVLAYEYLIEEAGYTHDDILVFFNDGHEFASQINDKRYNISKQHRGQNSDWPWPDCPPNIVDYPQNEETVKDEIADFTENTLTEKDNILIWIVAGHGGGSRTDQYADDFVYYSMGDNFWYLTENDNEIYNLFKFEDNNGNKKYKRCKILWSSCYSGHLLVGNKTLLNDGDNSNSDNKKMIAFTSTAYNKEGIITNSDPPGALIAEIHSGFTYAIYCTLKGADPYDQSIPINDPNNDGVINMKELYSNITTNKNFKYISYNDGGQNPQKGDPCPIEDFTYIDEVLKLKNHILSLVTGEDIRYYRVDQVFAGDNLIIPNNSNIEFVIDTKVKLYSKFHAKAGSRFHIRYGEIACSN